MSTGTREEAADYRERQRQYRKKRSLTDFNDSGGSASSHYSGKRFRILCLILLLIGLAVLAKLFYVQMIDASNLKHRAQLSRNQALTLFNRGRVTDRNGVVLAQDTLLYDLFVHPSYFYGIARNDVAAALAPVLHMDEAVVQKKLNAPYSTISIKKNLTLDEVHAVAKIRMPQISFNPKTKKMILDENGKPMTHLIALPGLDFSKKNVRNYPQGNLGAHILGYVNDEAGVSSGVEASAAQILKKKPTELSQTILDGRGNLVDLENLDPKHIVTLPKAQDVNLTIDARLQYIAERELAAGLQRTRASRGTVIMMDPHTGELLAFAVLPTYQPDKFYQASAEQLKNWAITDVYPPGSTFKIITLASALELGTITPDTKIFDTGRMKVGGWMIQNYDYGKHGAPGWIDLIYLLIHSSNIASAKISLGMPIPGHYNLLKRVGIGSKTGLDIPGESAGILLPESAWHDPSTHASIGYGYGMAATPIQMASAVAAIANGGIWNTPHVMSTSPVTHRRIFSAKTASEMTTLLTRSIREAKTSTVRLDSMDVAGKTGTSRKPNANGRGYSPNIFTSFVGFFPAQSPKVLIMVVMDSPKMAESWGSTVAGPVFKNIAEETISYMGLNPSGATRKTTRASTAAKNNPIPSAQTVNIPMATQKAR